jgi:Flp pilus assembly protein TadD
VLQQEGDLGGAAEDYRRALNEDPTEIQTLNHLADALRVQKPGSAEAAAAYAAFAREGARRVLLKFPDSSLAHRKMGTALFLQGRTADAGGELRRAVALDPNDADGHIEYGAMLEVTGQRAVALEQYRQALALRPGDASIERRIERARAGLTTTATTMP